MLPLLLALSLSTISPQVTAQPQPVTDISDPQPISPDELQAHVNFCMSVASGDATDADVDQTLKNFGITTPEQVRAEALGCLMYLQGLEDGSNLSKVSKTSFRK